MKVIENIIKWINAEMEGPSSGGNLHILFTIGVVVVSALMVMKLRDADDGTFRILIGVMFGVMLVLEIIKQVFTNMSVVDGEITFSYSWGQLPFQLCSTPLYVLPFLSFLPDCRLRDFAAAYTMTVSLIGGIAVYLTPKTVITARIFSNIQTLIHHGIQIVSGVYTAAYYRRRISRRFYFDGICVFAIMFAIANLLNTIGYDLLVANGLMAEGDCFNMFYISPRQDQPTPVLSDLLKSLPAVIYIAGYFIVVSFGAFLIMYFINYVYKNLDRRREMRLAGR